MNRLSGFLAFVGLCSILVGCARSAPLSPEEQTLREQRIRQLLSSGNRSLRAGDEGLDAALASYTIARELAPEDPRVLDGLGCVAWRKGNIDMAEMYFRRAAELDSRYDRPVAHLALVAEARGHRRAALGLLVRAVQMNPLSFRARNDFAAEILRIHRSGKELGEAHREILKALELAGPDEPVLRFNLEELNRRSGW